MAILGEDKHDTARGLTGRVSDFAREAGGVAVRSLDDGLKRVNRAREDIALPSVPLPPWLRRLLRPFKKLFVWLASLAMRAVRACLPGGVVAERFRSSRIVRFISRSLLRRILFTNIIGFAILFIGFLYMSLDSGWVINAKRDALRIQGQIIAAAIEGGAVTTSDSIAVDPDMLPGKEAAHFPMRDDGFAALELSLHPQVVAPILNRLIEPIKTRARIYDRSGTLVVDSSALLRSGQIIGTDQKPKTNTTRPTTKNFWTRLQHWLIDKEVQVYKEIGTANGKLYPEVRAALQGNPEAMLLLNSRGEQIVSMAVPIKRLGRVEGVLLLSTQPGDVDEILAQAREAIWPLAALALFAMIVTSLLMARTVGGPMKRLSEAANMVSVDINAHKDLPTYTDRKDEVGQMAKAFRSMTRALFERIEASEKFAADVAHELKNPLTAASSTAQSLEYAKNDEQRDVLVQQIQGELRRLNRLITDISSASRMEAELARQSADPVELDQVLTSVAAIFKDKADVRGCRIDLVIDDTPSQTNLFGDDFTVSGNEGRLAQVFTNLVDNALSFSPDGGTVTIRAQRAGDAIEVSVDDEGPGIEDDVLETIFDRFYTYRPDEYSSRGDNSGLGLNISRGIVRAHGGEIWAENRFATGDTGKMDERAGARFIVKLPALKLRTVRGASSA